MAWNPFKSLPRPSDVATAIVQRCRSFDPGAEGLVITWDDLYAICEGAATNAQAKGVAPNYWRDLIARLPRAWRRD